MAATGTWIGTTDQDYAVTTNWVEGAVPTTATNVRFPATPTRAVTLTLDQSAVAIGDFIVETGFAGAFGSDTLGFLQIDPNRFEFDGIGTAYIDLTTAAIDAQVKGTVGAALGKRGLYLLGSAIDDLSITGKSSVGVAFDSNTTATVATARVLGSSANLICGAGTTLTAASVNSGTLELRCAATTVEAFSGKLITDEIGAITTVNVFGGRAMLNSTGTITTLTIEGGATVDMMQSAEPRTITTLNCRHGTFIYDPDVVTIGTDASPNTPVSRIVTRI